MRVDFYLLNTDEPDAPGQMACRILDKAYRQGHRVFVYCDHLEQAEYIDELLWTFKIDSFIPHHLQGEGPEPPPPIQIGYEGEPRGFNDILLNLSKRIPPFFARFQRIIEIVPMDEASKTNSRDHYRQYRQAGAQLQTHQA